MIHFLDTKTFSEAFRNTNCHLIQISCLSCYLYYNTHHKSRLPLSVLVQGRNTSGASGGGCVVVTACGGSQPLTTVWIIRWLPSHYIVYYHVAVYSLQSCTNQIHNLPPRSIVKPSCCNPLILFKFLSDPISFIDSHHVTYCIFMLLSIPIHDFLIGFIISCHIPYRTI